MEIRYRYKGVPRFRIPQPWYEHTNWEPWDEDRVSWLLVNRNRRLIVQALIQGPLTLDELRARLQVHLNPYLTDHSGLALGISPEVLTNHLHTMEHHGLISQEGDRYVLNLPVLTLDDKKSLEPFGDALGRELAERLRKAGPKPEWLDPLLERATKTALEMLGKDYPWETYRRWVEEDASDEKLAPAKSAQ